MYFNFYICFFVWYWYGNYELCNRIKIAAGHKYKSVIKKKEKKHDKIVLLAKTKLNSIEVSISKAYIDSNINHDELVSINNGPKGYDNIKEEF